MLEHFKPLFAQYVSRDYGSGNTILFQGEAPRAACVVESGVVRGINISAQGEEQTIAFYTPGEFFPTSWIFDKTPTSLYFYEAVTLSRICFMPRAELIDSFQASPASQRLLVDYLATLHSAALLRIGALGQSKAREKIMLTLYYLCQRYGNPTKGGSVAISLNLTHQQVASLVGLTRETTATELNKLKRAKIVSYKNQRYTINLSKLLRLIGEDSFSDVQIHS
jgi:CRP/FNR family transcriptional regulator, cyclic AMP receptor protein